MPLIPVIHKKANIKRLKKSLKKRLFGRRKKKLWVLYNSVNNLATRQM